jgi:hypothetical protein
MPRKSKTAETATVAETPKPKPAAKKIAKAKAPPKHTPEELKQIMLDNLVKARKVRAEKRAAAK